MKSLQEYCFENLINIFEASREQIDNAKLTPGIHMIGGKCGWWATSEEFNNWLFDNNSKSKNTLKGMFFGIDKNIIKSIINKCYDACKNEFKEDLTYLTVPFVIYTDKTNKFAIRTNIQNILNIKSIIENELKKSNINNDIIEKINNIFDETHTGFGTSATKGLAFEPQLVEGLINYIIGLNSNIIETNKQYSDEEIKELNFSNPKLFKCCQQIDKLYNLKEYYKDVDNNELKNLIITTGTGKTARQQDIKIINPDNFNILSEGQINDLLYKSGEIIADVTCKPINKNNDPIYISCKIGKAQLSGITNNHVFYEHGLRKKSTELFSKYSNQNDNVFNPLRGFCKLLGLNFTKVFDFYQNLANNIDNVNKRETIEYNDYYIENEGKLDELKRLLICLIGSNYCYVNGDHPEKIVKVDFSKNTLSSINIKFSGGAGISKSGRTIKRKVIINDQKCFFCFRQSKEAHRYPYRFFIGDLDVEKFINSLNNEKT